MPDPRLDRSARRAAEAVACYLGANKCLPVWKAGDRDWRDGRIDPVALVKVVREALDGKPTSRGRS